MVNVPTLVQFYAASRSAIALLTWGFRAPGPGQVCSVHVSAEILSSGGRELRPTRNSNSAGGPAREEE